MQLVIFSTALVLFVADQVCGGPIVGGQFSPIHKYPWLASIQSGGYLKCGGSIISGFIIVTAAHCVSERPELYIVRVGSERTDSGGTWHNIVDIRLHESYNKSSRGVTGAESDVALIKVSPPIELGTYGAQIQLPKKGYVFPEGTNVSVVGWGSVSVRGEVIYELKSVNLHIIDSGECARKYGDWTGTGVKRRHQVCASEFYGGPCHGDSGGPLVTKDDVLVGIVSGGRSCGNNRYPGIYEDVGYYRDWIDQNSRILIQLNTSNTRTSHFVSEIF